MTQDSLQQLIEPRGTEPVESDPHKTVARGERSERVPTLWGLSPVGLHDRFWASFGVAPVRRADSVEVVEGPRLYLLTDADMLLSFPLDTVLEKLDWPMSGVAFVEVKDERKAEYREFAQKDASDRFRGFQRVYGRFDSDHVTVALTPEREIAERWRRSASLSEGIGELRIGEVALPEGRLSLSGRVDDASRSDELAEWAKDIVSVWSRPDLTIAGIEPIEPGIWASADAEVDEGAKVYGPVWIGAGRGVQSSESVAGPAVIWDAEGIAAEAQEVDWESFQPRALSSDSGPMRRSGSVGYFGKRAFDIICALIGLAVTLPLYPVIMLLTFIEDGWPFFFSHERETLGGRRFGCVKFRTMRNDAEEIKARLLAENENQSDGPQFFMENDPRVLKCGDFLRKSKLDEVPQFWNVLLGHMSMVGPRPSPFEENQCCPPWREVRLSVRPGITGFWQVKRSRQPGLDFQEWIRYDLEYVERMSFWTDLKTLWATVAVVIQGK